MADLRTTVTVDYPFLAKILDELKDVTEKDIKLAEPTNLGERDQIILGDCTQEEKQLAGLYKKLVSEHNKLCRKGKCPGGHEYLQLIRVMVEASISERLQGKEKNFSSMEIIAGWKIAGTEITEEENDLLSDLEKIAGVKLR